MSKSKILVGGFVLLTACVLLFSGCEPSQEQITPEEYLARKLSYVIQSKLATDLEIIDDSLEQWNITPLIEPKGVRYVIHALGTGPKPTLSSNISVQLRAKFLKTGATAYQQNMIIRLYDLVIGVQTTLPLIPEGSVVTLYVPSQYAFGAIEVNENGTTIPPNSNLIYEIELLGVF